ncbi:hypothetical protein AOQ71_02500 [Bradyrhizobium manausense]|uniref:Uncharacterized protein n=1 Tax=Bradyrhizobium manausense TaxID=989370 RepID=A0A0R3DKB9_9BRAD|nr:hypothetical protein AOQ71_19015 [Bradyrhizobium manausense]KRQ15634.1 hypothetical protein AOQ71_08825 [Bradyrhizobium manausense]KRQ17369.1 hypothetical protein AOQ71_02500 [Bradyrhizobium manausense]
MVARLSLADRGAARRKTMSENLFEILSICFSPLALQLAMPPAICNLAGFATASMQRRDRIHAGNDVP